MNRLPENYDTDDHPLKWMYETNSLLTICGKCSQDFRDGKREDITYLIDRTEILCVPPPLAHDPNYEDGYCSMHYRESIRKVMDYAGENPG